MFDPGVERALVVVLGAHFDQVRKGSGVPYVVHPLHVALLLARLGYPSEVIQAGLLHDVVEDCADWNLKRVELEFGACVASIVGEVTEDKSRSWEERKQWTVEQVPTLSPEAVAVKACDKLHNLEGLVRALMGSEGTDMVWAHFRGGRDRTIEVASQLVDALALRLDGPLVEALRQALANLRRI